MFGKNFQRKYALTDQGVKNAKKGAFWTVIVNLVVMGGMGILYLLMYGLMGTLTDGAPLPGPALFLGLVIAFVILSFVTHLQQYHATYGLVYNEVKSTRLSLAERLRKLPLGYFGKRDLADLTETLMGDVNRMEHVWSHVLGYLYGAYISTAIIAVSEMLGLATYSALSQLDLRVPQDVSLIVFDDTAWTQAMGITVIKHDDQEVVQYAVDRLTGLIDGRYTKVDHHVILPYLECRNSVRKMLP